MAQSCGIPGSVQLTCFCCDAVENKNTAQGKNIPTHPSLTLCHLETVRPLYSIFCNMRGHTRNEVCCNTNLADQQQRLFHWRTHRRNGRRPDRTLWLYTHSSLPSCYLTASQTPQGCRAPHSHTLL